MTFGNGARTTALIFTIGLAACSGVPGGGSSGSFTSTFTGAPAAAKPEAETLECPPIDVRQGASTYTVYGAGGQAATNVRYQGTIADTARECGFLGPNVTMKVGLQGRVIVGPAGGPGRVDVPLRIAVVKEGPNPVTVWTKSYRVAVDVSGINTTFEHIESNLTFPRPPGGDIDSYVIYAGYDPAVPGTKAAPTGRKSRKARRAQ